MRPVVCIRHQQPHELGIAGQVFEEAGVPYAYVDAWLDPGWPRLDDVSGLVVLGGDMHADQVERYAFLSRERELLGSAVEQGVPVMGICLGAQILARAAGADVARSPVMEIGFRPVTPTDEGRRDPVLAPFAEGIRVFQWHEDTFELAPGMIRLCTSPDVPNQAFRIGGTAYGVQFHPEATERGIAAWVHRWIHVVIERGRTPDDMMREARVCLPEQERASREAFRAFAALLDRA